MIRSSFKLVFLLLLLPLACRAEIRTGAGHMEDYLPMLHGKNIALVANHTSLVGKVHLLDTLLSRGIEKARIRGIFCPEHGFRGELGAGAEVVDGRDAKTGLPIYSLYGSSKKPSEEQLEGIDLILFDLQDVGTRFYTYISTLHYVMEACAGEGIPLLILDRPNPNGNYVDGPVLDTAYRSFVGMHPIPVVHGLSMGELARMINGESWLGDGLQCQVTVIPCSGYERHMDYEPPVKPSPNLNSLHSIRMYPSTCFFEGTVISEGRGTQTPFRIYGHPELDGSFMFTPESIPGMAMKPKFLGEECRGEDLRGFRPPKGWNRIELKFLLDAYAAFPSKEDFFIPYFDLLAGSDVLRKQIQMGMKERAIRKSWKPGLEKYLKMREQYLIYE